MGHEYVRQETAVSIKYFMVKAMRSKSMEHKLNVGAYNGLDM